MPRSRYNASGSGGSSHANRASIATPSESDPLSLVRSFDSEATPTRPVRPSPLSASIIHGLPLDLLNRIRSFPLFVSAPDGFLAAIGSYLRPQLHNPRDYILNEGDEAKAMYWLVRGALIVTSRDAESTYAELKPGAIFGEIGLFMNIPRTATIIAKLKSLVVRLSKEDMQKVLPNYPQVERTIRHEALERLAILERKKKELSESKNRQPQPEVSESKSPASSQILPSRAATKRPRSIGSEVFLNHHHNQSDAESLSSASSLISCAKKRKSPSPSIANTLASSALGSGSVNVRKLLTEFPLFSSLPHEILHFVGLNAQPVSYPPFTNIIKQGSVGRDVYFIVRGEVEVVNESEQTSATASIAITNPSTHSKAPLLLVPPPQSSHRRSQQDHQPIVVKARLRPGQYFGEVTNLALAPKRTATVRSISAVEALIISGQVLDQLWNQCSPDLKRQVERTARERLQTVEDSDTLMTDADESDSSSKPSIAKLEDTRPPLSPNTKGMFSLQETTSMDEPRAVESIDPDPYLNIDLENVKSRSRRSSLAPPSPSSASNSPRSPSITTPPSDFESPLASPNRIIPSPSSSSSSSHVSTFHNASFLAPLKLQLEAITLRKFLSAKRVRIQKHSKFTLLNDQILCRILQHFDFVELMRLRLVSQHWHDLITNSPDLATVLDLTPYNKYITDHILVKIIAPFAGSRPRYVDISNCFHVTDDGFIALVNQCAQTAIVWKMKSVWDITGQAVLDMANKAKRLQEIDLSNCRKVGDNLLARVIGWVVQNSVASPVSPAPNRPAPPPPPSKNANRPAPLNLITLASPPLTPLTPVAPAATTVVGCPALKKLVLSYCKHITDRSMAHIATYASSRIEEIDFTRCTTITDAGFHYWSVANFPHLTRLCLADCTYLTDNAIVWLAHAARGLTWLDLSFCCALSDIATEVLALGCTSLRHLNLSFCGSAVSDNSLCVVARHLTELRSLSVRGCVRVTGAGVIALIDGCERLRDLDVSQCRNLLPWMEAGGRQELVRRRRRMLMMRGMTVPLSSTRSSLRSPRDARMGGTGDGASARDERGRRGRSTVRTRRSIDITFCVIAGQPGGWERGLGLMGGPGGHGDDDINDDDFEDEKEADDDDEDNEGTDEEMRDAE